MIIAILHFISQPPVIITSWIELLTVTVVFSGFIGIYRHLECHEESCHRPGKYIHGHLKLCAKHHPAVNGKNSKQDIEEVTKNLTK